MLTRLDELDEGAEIACDVAIVGAGAAGITLARELAGAGLTVTLAESGLLDVDGPTQTLNEGEIRGLPYEPLESARARVLGGTTALWTGWCKPLDPVDLAARPALGLPGWPIAPEELAPYYARAMPHLEIGPNRFDGQPWRELGEAFDALDPARLALTFWERSPPVRFGERYRDELSASPRIRVLLGANLTGIRLEPDRAAAVRHLDLASLGGRRARLKAGRYVLACGGIENARLLLASDDVAREGVGNRSRLVGRHFMEHPQLEVAQVFPEDVFPFLDRYYRRRQGGRLHRIGWQLPPAAQEPLGAANHAAEILIEPGREGVADRASALLGEVAGGRIPGELDRRLLEVLSDLGGAARGAWRKYAGGKEVNKPPRALGLHVTVDPAPNPDSRVTLGGDRDALGLRRAVLDWRLSPADGRGVAALAGAVAAELGRLGLARVRLHPALEDPTGAWIAGRANLAGHGANEDMPPMHISWHHMGTTRMAADPALGVVDADCRVHGVANLHLAGSSVFPSTGNANPTFTIVALAVRLADHLRARLAA